MIILFIVRDTDYIEPLGLMSISAVARKAGHDCRLCITARQDVFAVIRSVNPAIIAYSASTGEHAYYSALNKMISRSFPDIFTIMGGPHATFCPSYIGATTLNSLCIGEGEGAFSDVLEAVAAGRPVTGIRNIVTRQAPHPSLRDLIADLDTLPFPDRKLLYDCTEMGEAPLKSFITSRGCPYSCAYCFNDSFRQLYEGKGAPVRRHSITYVIDQINSVRNAYRLEFIKFYDDIFAYTAEGWLEEFARKYAAQVRLPFHCLTRADLMTEDMARLLADAGCRSVSMSIETGNPTLRKDVLHRDMDDRKIIAAFDICRRHGIHTFSNNIVGLPFSRIDDELRTLDLNLKCRVSFAEFPIFHPYPGTELGRLCIKKGIFNAEYDALPPSYMHRSPLQCFTKSQKAAQSNFALLAPVVILFPWMRRAVKVLISLPLHALYVLLYYLAKSYMVPTRIYPVRMSVKERLTMAFKSLRLEIRKHSAKNRMECV